MNAIVPRVIPLPSPSCWPNRETQAEYGASEIGHPALSFASVSATLESLAPSNSPFRKWAYCRFLEIIGHPLSRIHVVDLLVWNLKLTKSPGSTVHSHRTPTAPPDSDMSSEKENISPESSARKNKGKSLLHVPSRTPSQRQQSSPTASSGISGVTATDSRQSLGNISKESTPSIQSRQRNGSASSRRSRGETEPTTSMPSQPVSPAAPPHKKKKSGGFLALLGCCGSPAENTADGSEENVHPLDKIPNRRPTTAKSRAHTPSEQQTANTTKTQLDEKDAAPQVSTKEGPSKEKRQSNTSAHGQSAVGGEQQDGESKQAAVPAPSVRVEPPNGGPVPESQVGQHASTEKSQDEEGDIKMGEDGGSGDQPEAAEQHREKQKEKQQDEQLQPQKEDDDQSSGQQAAYIPPPPPGPAPSDDESAAPPQDAVVIAPESEQRCLLPPIAPEHMGRKCLVLDLDETLVHSSFKVRRRF